MQMPTQTPIAPVPPGPPAQPRSYVALRTGIVMIVVVIVATIIAGLLPGSVVTARNLAYPQPNISVSASTSNPHVGDTVQFTVQVNAGNELTYTWDFGDNSNAVPGGPVMSHAYSDYCQQCIVTVTATDPIQHTATATTSVSVLPPPPTASFSYQEVDPYSFCVQFDASASTGTNLTFVWTYGDNSTPDQGQSPGAYHCYYQSGTYTVNLTVTDGFGQFAQTSSTISL